MYFVLNNADNVARRKTSTRSVFWDDCGVWSSEGTRTPPFYYLLREEGPPAYKQCVKGVFGKRFNGCFEALTLQPVIASASNQAVLLQAEAREIQCTDDA